MTCLRREWTVNDALLFCCFSHILNAHIFMHWGFLGVFFGVSIIPLPLFTLIFCFQLPLIKLHLHSFILDSWSHRYLRMLQGNCFKKEKEAAGLEKALKAKHSVRQRASWTRLCPFSPSTSTPQCFLQIWSIIDGGNQHEGGCQGAFFSLLHNEGETVFWDKV